MSAIRKLAAEAADNGLLAPELAAGINRVKSAKSQGDTETHLRAQMAAPGESSATRTLVPNGVVGSHSERLRVAKSLPIILIIGQLL